MTADLGSPGHNATGDDRGSAHADDFVWRDGDRLVRFGRGCIREAVELLGGPGFTLLTTPTAGALCPDLVDAASDVHRVRAGRVDEIASELLPKVSGPRIVGLGGGRVIDVAKALAAAGAEHGSRAMAVPTTLSGAEMTWIHRLPVGVEVAQQRAVVVVNDPELSASLAEGPLAASTLNALAHALEGPCTTMTNPIAALAADEAVVALIGAWEGPQIDRERLALGALLSGFVIDSTWYGLHHVLSQTLVRLTGIEHSDANAAILPHTIAALTQRSPARFGRLEGILREPLASATPRIAARAGIRGLRRLGVTQSQLVECAETAAKRPELEHTLPRADYAEILRIYRAAA